MQIFINNVKKKWFVVLSKDLFINITCIRFPFNQINPEVDEKIYRIIRNVATVYRIVGIYYADIQFLLPHK